MSCKDGSSHCVENGLGGGAGAGRLLQVMDDGDLVRREAVEMERHGWL